LYLSFVYFLIKNINRSMSPPVSIKKVKTLARLAIEGFNDYRSARINQDRVLTNRRAY
jgi:hypothetical protein